MKYVVALAFVACAPAAPRPAAPARPPSTTAADAGLVDMTPAVGVDVPSLDQLAARGATDAPMMRETKRVADATTPTLVESGAVDACFRAVVAASQPVKAWFADAANGVRGEIADGAGLVPPRGPVCAKKGETLRLVVNATTPGTVARAVVWQSP